MVFSLLHLLRDNDFASIDPSACVLEITFKRKFKILIFGSYFSHRSGCDVSLLQSYGPPESGSKKGSLLRFRNHIFPILFNHFSRWRQHSISVYLLCSNKVHHFSNLHGNCTAIKILYPYTAEIYETMIRGKAMGICSVSGRIGATLLGFTGMYAMKWFGGNGLYVLFILLSGTSGYGAYTMPFCTGNRSITW